MAHAFISLQTKRRRANIPSEACKGSQAEFTTQQREIINKRTRAISSLLTPKLCKDEYIEALSESIPDGVTLVTSTESHSESATSVPCLDKQGP